MAGALLLVIIPCRRWGSSGRKNGAHETNGLRSRARRRARAGRTNSAFNLTKGPGSSTINPDRRMVKIASQPDALLAWMDCLADPMRLRLLRILERHEVGVADLCDVVQAPQSTVSR